MLPFSLTSIVDMWTTQTMGGLNLGEGKRVPEGPRPAQDSNHSLS